MDIYDTHAHFSEDSEKAAATLARARAAGVARLMAVGGSPELNRAALLAQSLAPDATRLALGADRDQAGDASANETPSPLNSCISLAVSRSRHGTATARCGENGTIFRISLNSRFSHVWYTFTPTPAAADSRISVVDATAIFQHFIDLYSFFQSIARRMRPFR